MEFSRQENWSGWPSPGHPILLLGTFLTQRWNSSLLHCRQALCHLSYQGNAEKECGVFIGKCASVLGPINLDYSSLVRS